MDSKNSNRNQLTAEPAGTPAAGQPLYPVHEQVLQIIEFFPDATLVVDRDGRVIAWNKAMEEMTGILKEDMLGKGDYEYSIPFYRERRPLLIDLLFQGDEISRPRYEFIERKDGALFAEFYAPFVFEGKGGYLSAKASILSNSSGNVVGAIESIRDITDRKVAEQALKDSEERCRNLGRLSPMGIAILANGRIELANEAFGQMLGARPEALCGMNPLDFVHADYVALAKDRMKRAETEKKQNPLLEQKFVRIDGSVIDVEALSFPFNSGGSDRIMVVSQDITQRKKAQEALGKREKELRVKSESLEEANTALKVLLKHRNEDKKALEDAILSNIKELVLPYLEKLRIAAITENQAMLLDIIESNLNSIISPFLQRMTSIYSGFTRTEIQIANLIRGGKTSKEIAELMNVSIGTVHAHRVNIRSKLGISNKDVNLQTYLISMA
jgi:PAS domain S-box-containing protein